VNIILYHKLHHYEKCCLHLQAYQQLKGRQERWAYFNAHLFLSDRPPSEAHIPYEKRPCEWDACAFADEHAPHELLVHSQQAYAVLLSLALVEICEQALLTWLKRIGGWVLKRRRDALIYYPAADDVEHLARFLQRHGNCRVIVAADAVGIPIARLQQEREGSVIAPYPAALIPLQKPMPPLL
jgi:hypothetical protein